MAQYELEKILLSSYFIVLQFFLVLCCFVAINAMPNPQGPKGALVATAESGHFSYDGMFSQSYFKIFACVTKSNFRFVFLQRS